MPDRGGVIIFPGRTEWRQARICLFSSRVGTGSGRLNRLDGDSGGRIFPGSIQNGHFMLLPDFTLINLVQTGPGPSLTLDPGNGCGSLLPSLA